jgi:hypothetical protein
MSDDEWSSSDDGGVAPPTSAGPSSLANLFGEPVAEQPKPPAVQPAAAAPAAAQPTTPQVVHTCPVQAYTYDANRQATPRGPHNAVLLSFPAADGAGYVCFFFFFFFFFL